MSEIELVIDARAALGEGAIWDHKKKLLYWLDIVKKEIHIFNPENAIDRIIESDQMIGTIVPRKSGGMLVATEKGFYFVNSETADFSFIADPESDIPGNRFNDGKCDPAGRLWAGTMCTDGESEAGSLYCLDTDLSVSKKLSKISISNGIAWSSDKGKMYYIDTPTKEVWSYDFDKETGKISNKRVVVTFADGEGFPDGMTVDVQGMIWVAHWDGWRVSRWNPETGNKLNEIYLPASRVTSCAFGGASLDELYITTANTGLGREQFYKQPHAGGLFRVKTDVQGIPAFEFGG